MTPRLATANDNAACLDLFGAVPMRGELVLSTQRGPDFFSLYEMQKARAFTWVGDDERGGLMGMATALVRDGWLDGAPTRVGYLGDLRVRFDRGRAFGRFFGETFNALCAETKCDTFITSILSSNGAALNALTRRKGKRTNQPHYAKLHDIDAVSVQLTRARTPSRDVTVRTATSTDLPQLVDALSLAHRARPFGYRYDDGEFQHRLARWPGFSLDETLLAVNARGDLLGCCTVWDPSPVKRYRVDAYNGQMKWVKRGFNLAAALARWPKLPQPGQEFRYAYLTNVWVRDESPATFRALVEHAYARLQPRGFHFFTFELGVSDVLNEALRGFMTRRLGFSLYGVTPASVARTTWQPGRTGFEMALA